MDGRRWLAMGVSRWVDRDVNLRNAGEFRLCKVDVGWKFIPLEPLQGSRDGSWLRTMGD